MEKKNYGIPDGLEWQAIEHLECQYMASAAIVNACAATNLCPEGQWKVSGSKVSCLICTRQAQVWCNAFEHSIYLISLSCQSSLKEERCKPINESITPMVCIKGISVGIPKNLFIIVSSRNFEKLRSWESRLGPSTPGVRFCLFRKLKS